MIAMLPDIFERPALELPVEYSVVSCQPNDTLEMVLLRLCEHGIGCVLITENDRLVGIFTERDYVMRVASKGIDVKTARIGDFMTKDPVSIGIDQPIMEVVKAMRRGNFRHVVLVEGDGRPVAIASVRDINSFMCDVLNLT